MTGFPPWEPPFQGDEAGAVFGALDRLRTTFRWKCADLDASGLATRTAASSLTLGGLLKHLAVQEDHCFQVKVLGAPMPAPWDLSAWETEGDDWEFDSAANDRPQPGDEQQPKPLAGRVGQGREQRAESGKDAGLFGNYPALCGNGDSFEVVHGTTHGSHLRDAL